MKRAAFQKSAWHLSNFEQGALFEKLSAQPDFLTKRMFGGLAIYYGGLMVACLMEDKNAERVWKKKKYDIPLWRGILIPTFHVHHDSLKVDLPGTLTHPVLKKWLYLPLDSEHYAESADIFIRLITRHDPRLGV